MHLNYFFLRKLVDALRSNIIDTKLVEAFSQDKDEIVLKFDPRDGDRFVIRAILRADFTCLYFPDRFERARANSVDLFRPLYGLRVSELRMFTNERAFAILFNNGARLLFKMFGNRSNLLMYEAGEVLPRSVFNNRLKADLNLEEATLDRPLDFTFERLRELNGDYRQLFPTFGKWVNAYVETQFKANSSLEEKWTILEQVMAKLSADRFYLTKVNNELILSMLELGEVQEVFSNPIEAVNNFCLNFLRVGHLQKEKDRVVKRLQKRLSQTENYLTASYDKLARISELGKNEQYGNLIMANLHRIEPRAEHIDVENFYTGEWVRIKLKPDLTPARNAELYFRKAKNEKLELTHLQENIEAREAELAEIKQWLVSLEEISTVKELRSYMKQIGILHQATEADEPIRFRKENYMGYEIFIGKNARHNDELTFKFAKKDDLWLHAKDVTGSHVIIRSIPGRKTPSQVIERAAELAAWNSKRRNDSLCPVTVTPRKFVRKAKGLAPGAVKVEKESVVMVVPKA